MDKAKIDKMSGVYSTLILLWEYDRCTDGFDRRANCPNVRAHASYQEARVGRERPGVPGCHWPRSFKAKLENDLMIPLSTAYTHSSSANRAGREACDHRRSRGIHLCGREVL